MVFVFGILPLSWCLSSSAVLGEWENGVDPVAPRRPSKRVNGHERPGEVRRGERPMNLRCTHHRSAKKGLLGPSLFIETSRRGSAPRHRPGLDHARVLL